MPTIIAYKTKSGLINAIAVAANGETLNYISQGFPTRQGLLKNLRATYQKNITMVIKWKKNSRTKTILKTEEVIL